MGKKLEYSDELGDIGENVLNKVMLNNVQNGFGRMLNL